MVMVAAAVFWTIGAGFFGDLDAKSEETYEGLKIFADVIHLLKKSMLMMSSQRTYPKCHPGHGSKLRSALLIIATGSV